MSETKERPKYLGEGKCSRCKQEIFWFQSQSESKRLYPTNSKDHTDFHSKTCPEKKSKLKTGEELAIEEKKDAFSEYLGLRKRLKEVEPLLLKCGFKFTVCLQDNCALWNKEKNRCSFFQF